MQYTFMIHLTLRVQYNKKTVYFKKKIGRKREGNLRFLEGNLAKKKDKNEKFYFAKVEALPLLPHMRLTPVLTHLRKCP